MTYLADVEKIKTVRVQEHRIRNFFVRRSKLIIVVFITVMFLALFLAGLRGLLFAQEDAITAAKAQAIVERARKGMDLISFDWREVLPELHPVWKVFKDCADGLRESVHIQNMSQLYTCGVAEASKMQAGWGCTTEGEKHLQRILRPFDASAGQFLQEYESFELEDRGHGKASAMQTCGEKHLQLEPSVASWFQPNASLQLIDRSPCHSSYKFVSTGRGHRAATGPADQHFATTHHLGSVSLKKAEGVPCSRRMAEAIKVALGTQGMQYKNPMASFRGIYWYPPGGFTEWHTDGNQVRGWRLYLADIDEEGRSVMAVKDKDKRLLVWDRFYQANMFRVNPENPLFHAVAAQETHRVSFGIAISDKVADRILRTVKAKDLVERHPRHQEQ